MSNGQGQIVPMARPDNRNPASAPRAAPAADASQILVQALEEACANGKLPGGRLLPVIVDETATTVTITVLARRLENADCQGNPRFPLQVALSAPLGDRVLLDGSAYPRARRN